MLQLNIKYHIEIEVCSLVHTSNNVNSGGLDRSIP